MLQRPKNFIENRGEMSKGIHGDTGKRTGRAFVFQPAAEYVPDVTET